MHTFFVLFENCIFELAQPWLSMQNYFYRMLSMRKTFFFTPSACVEHFLPHPQHAKKQNGENQPQSSTGRIFSQSLSRLTRQNSLK